MLLFPKNKIDYKNVQNTYKISICFPIKDWLFAFSEVLEHNLEMFSQYEALEFVILDYGSSDGLLEWVFDNYQQFIQGGYIKYFRYEADYFDQSHARNMAFRLASGDIVFSIDADNYIDLDFPRFLNILANQYTDKNKVFIASKQTIRGRVGFFRDDVFRLTGGFDEEEDIGKSYCAADRDIVRRASRRDDVIFMWIGNKYFEKIMHKGRMRSYPVGNRSRQKYMKRKNNGRTIVNQYASGRIEAGKGTVKKMNGEQINLGDISI